MNVQDNGSSNSFGHAYFDISRPETTVSLLLSSWKPSYELQTFAVQCVDVVMIYPALLLDGIVTEYDGQFLIELPLRKRLSFFDNCPEICLSRF